jgi:hypothetical protein
MKTPDVIALGSRYLNGLVGHIFDVLTLSKPVSPAAAVNLAKIISKLSPLMGNLIEFNTCEYLNQQEGFAKYGRWQRQDPGFPDTIFAGSVSPTPGFEIKAWFPLATEITARFKDSYNHFSQDQTYVVILAWLPEFLVFGRAKIVDIVVVSGASVARARDDHYHNPPDYIVIEPGDTVARSINLQQTTTSGHKFQGDAKQFAQAQAIVNKWGNGGRAYLPTPQYQLLLRELISNFPYRLDTNFAKMDRIAHKDIEAFKERVYATSFLGRAIGDWNRLLSRGNESEISRELARRFDIHEQDHPVVK